MSLPLLALRVAEVSNPLPSTTIKIVFKFNPNTTRENQGASFRFNGPSVLMVVIGYEDLSPKLRAAAIKLSDWLSESMNDVSNMMGNNVPGSKVNREWSMTWGQFNRAIALYTCPKVNTPTMKVVDGKEAPYTVSRFEHRLLGGGRQVVTVEFAVDEELLDKWIG